MSSPEAVVPASVAVVVVVAVCCQLDVSAGVVKSLGLPHDHPLGAAILRVTVTVHVPEVPEANVPAT
jgi:hypothetical protein